MNTRRKISLVFIATCVLFAVFMAADPAYKQQGQWLASAFLFPASYFVLMSIIVYIGDIKSLFDYAWIFHALQFAVYGSLFAFLWIRGNPRKASLSVIISHLVMICVYIGWGTLFVR